MLFGVAAPQSSVSTGLLSGKFPLQRRHDVTLTGKVGGWSQWKPFEPEPPLLLAAVLLAERVTAG